MARPLDIDPITARLENVDEGKRISRFVIRLNRRRGVRGAVYKARYVSNRDSIEITILDPDMMQQQPGVRDWFMYQAGLAAQIEHPNILKVIESGEDQLLNYVAAEDPGGVNLLEVVEKSGPLPLNAVLNIGESVIGGLAAAHEIGVYLCSVRPDRVLVTPTGEILFCGPGIPDVETPDIPERIRTNFWSPEECAGQEDIDPRADMYSFGTLLFYLLTAKLPVSGEDTSKIAAAMRHGAIHSVQDFKPDTPVPLAGLVDRLLSVDRLQRPSDPAAVFGELKTMYDTLGAASLPPYNLAARAAESTGHTAVVHPPLPPQPPVPPPAGTGTIQPPMPSQAEQSFPPPAEQEPSLGFLDSIGQETGQSGQVVPQPDAAQLGSTLGSIPTADIPPDAQAQSPMTAAQLGQVYESGMGTPGGSESYSDWYNRKQPGSSGGVLKWAVLIVVLAVIGAGGYIAFDKLYLKKKQNETVASDKQRTRPKPKPKPAANKPVPKIPTAEKARTALDKGDYAEAENIIRKALDSGESGKELEPLLADIFITRFGRMLGGENPQQIEEAAGSLASDTRLGNSPHVNAYAKMLLAEYQMCNTEQWGQALNNIDKALRASKETAPVLHARLQLRRALFSCVLAIEEPSALRNMLDAARGELDAAKTESPGWHLANLEEKFARAFISAQTGEDLGVSLPQEIDWSPNLFPAGERWRLSALRLQAAFTAGDRKPAKLLNLSESVQPTWAAVPLLPEYDRLIDADIVLLAPEADRIAAQLDSQANVYGLLHSAKVFCRSIRKMDAADLSGKIRKFLEMLDGPSVRNTLKRKIRADLIQTLRAEFSTSFSESRKTGNTSEKKRAAAVRAIVISGLDIFLTGTGKAVREVHDPSTRAFLATVLLDTLPPDISPTDELAARETGVRMLKQAGDDGAANVSKLVIRAVTDMLPLLARHGKRDDYKRLADLLSDTLANVEKQARSGNSTYRAYRGLLKTATLTGDCKCGPPPAPDKINVLLKSIIEDLDAGAEIVRIQKAAVIQLEGLGSAFVQSGDRETALRVFSIAHDRAVSAGMDTAGIKEKMEALSGSATKPSTQPVTPAKPDIKALRESALQLAAAAGKSKKISDRLKTYKKALAKFDEYRKAAGKYADPEHAAAVVDCAYEQYRSAANNKERAAVLKSFGDVEKRWRDLYMHRVTDAYEYLTRLYILKALGLQAAGNTSGYRKALQTAAGMGRLVEKRLDASLPAGKMGKKKAGEVLVLALAAEKTWNQLLTIKIPGAGEGLMHAFEVQALARIALEQPAAAEVAWYRALTTASTVYKSAKKDKRAKLMAKILEYSWKLGDARAALKKFQDAKKSYQYALKVAGALKMKKEAAEIRKVLEALPEK